MWEPIFRVLKYTIVIMFEYIIILYTGRINLVDLQQILNVDFRHIEDKVTEMVKQDKSLMLVLGQLVDK